MSPERGELENFMFDAGHIQTQAELAAEAEERVRLDKSLRQALKKHKSEISTILQACLDRVNEQLMRGRPVCQVAHFPAVNSAIFNDLEAMAKHDFKVDLHVDEVDNVLMNFIDSVMQIVFSNVRLENHHKVKAVERHAEAVMARMQTLEHHLLDRSRQLSNCRHAYYLEITHLRSQLYIREEKGPEHFQANEVYFFDPSEFLDEDLRRMLNDKIALSVKELCTKMAELKARNEELEMKLASGGEVGNGEEKESWDFVLQAMLGKRSAGVICTTLHKLSKKDVEKWATHWATSNGFSKEEAAPQESFDHVASNRANETLKEAMMRLSEELEDEKRDRSALEEELRLLKKEASADSQSQVDVPGLKSAKEELEREVGRLRFELAAAQPRESEVVQATASTAPPVVVAKPGSQAAIAALTALHWKLLTKTKKMEQKMMSKAKELNAIDDQKMEQPTSKGPSKEPKVPDDQLQDAVGKMSGSVQGLMQRCDELEAEVEALRATNTRLASAVSQNETVEEHEETVPEVMQTRLDDVAAPVVEAVKIQTSSSEAQSRIAFMNGSFCNLDQGKTLVEASIEEELRDLEACAKGNWEVTLQTLRMSMKPPEGKGSGKCSRAPFVRLFHGAMLRLQRYDELRTMVNALRRAELQKILEAVHLLMESSLPDHDTALRDAVFGRGMAQVALDSTQRTTEFEFLQKRWRRLTRRIFDILQQDQENITLGTHPGRRIFVPGGGGGYTAAASGGAGGGLAARQRKDVSPTRERLYDGIVQTDDEDLFQLLYRNGSSLYNSDEDEVADSKLLLQGKAIFPFGPAGGVPALGSVSFTEDSYVSLPSSTLAAERRKMDIGSIEHVAERGLPRSHNLRILRAVGGGFPAVFEAIRQQRPQRSRSTSPSPVRSNDKAAAHNVGRVRGRPSTAPTSNISSAWQRDGVTVSKEELDIAATKAVKFDWSMPATASTAGSSQLHFTPSSPEGATSKSANESLACEDGNAADLEATANADVTANGKIDTIEEPNQDILAALKEAAHTYEEALTTGSTATGSTRRQLAEQEAEKDARVAVHMLYLPFGSDKAAEMEARLATSLQILEQEMSPAGNGLQAVRQARGGLVHGGGWMGSVRAPNADREVERARRQRCEGLKGPLPTWEFEQEMDQRQRPVGGKYTTLSRYDSSGALVSRPSSAARIFGRREELTGGTGLRPATASSEKLSRYLPKSKSNSDLNNSMKVGRISSASALRA